MAEPPGFGGGYRQYHRYGDGPEHRASRPSVPEPELGTQIAGYPETRTRWASGHHPANGMPLFQGYAADVARLVQARERMRGDVRPEQATPVGRNTREVFESTPTPFAQEFPRRYFDSASHLRSPSAAPVDEWFSRIPTPPGFRRIPLHATPPGFRRIPPPATPEPSTSPALSGSSLTPPRYLLQEAPGSPVEDGFRYSGPVAPRPVDSSMPASRALAGWSRSPVPPALRGLSSPTVGQNKHVAMTELYSYPGSFSNVERVPRANPVPFQSSNNGQSYDLYTGTSSECQNAWPPLFQPSATFPMSEQESHFQPRPVLSYPEQALISNPGGTASIAEPLAPPQPRATRMAFREAFQERPAISTSQPSQYSVQPSFNGRLPHALRHRSGWYSQGAVLLRLRNLPAKYFREDGSVDIHLNWALDEIGSHNFERGRNDRAQLKNNSWIRTRGEALGLPAEVVQWLSGEIEGGILNVPAYKAKKFWTKPIPVVWHVR